jgi:hypothetical protein
MRESVHSPRSRRAYSCLKMTAVLRHAYASYQVMFETSIPFSEA